ncbi:metallophosphoesterase [Paraburkholderia sp. A3BS-1L]|uniref:metallophosphoesterase n=1 Tax=Paraburkholderia sp. A3BS-1L TaxID=3028375 RepID=UPI003DA7D0A1
MTQSFTWLHLSDLHVGQDGYQWLWPKAKTAFFDDLPLLLEKSGPLDMVVFSGDLTQRGDVKEFELLRKLLHEIWEAFDKLGSCPQLFTVPGNHDLVRPDADSAMTVALNRWWSEPVVETAFWKDGKNEYRQHVNLALTNYTQWHSSLAADGIPIVNASHGLLPGDSIATIDTHDLKIGVVGLNSAFLNLTKDSAEQKLLLDGRQLLSLTNDDPVRWASTHDLTLLVTHHPPTWLHPTSHQKFLEEIYSTAVFDAHLYGHMHEPNAASNATFGSNPRRYVQAASLFGLEKARDGRVTRMHGYSATRVDLGQREMTWRYWPRTAMLQNDGDRSLVPDYKFKLGSEQCTIESALRKRGDEKSRSQSTELTPTSGVDRPITFDTDKPNSRALENARFALSPAPQYANVMTLQQEICKAAISEQRLAWISAEWGMNAEGFIFSVLRERRPDDCFRLDASSFESSQQFLGQVAEQLGGSFADFCKALAARPQPVLILDDVPLEAASAVLTFSHVVLDYCVGLTLFIVTRGTPRNTVDGLIRLSPLDELETRSYVTDHPAATSEMVEGEAIEAIYRFSEGVPLDIDRAIRRLRIVSIEDLGSAGFLEEGTARAAPEFPAGLVKAVSSVAQAANPFVQRALYLLKILTVLPLGESIRRLKHFDQQIPLFDEQAEELLDRNLVEVRAASVSISGQAASERKKILVAPRPVRDYVRTLMSAEEEEFLTNKAMDLYFGEQWRLGEPKFKKSDSGSVTEEGTVLHNPHTILVKMLDTAVLKRKKDVVDKVVSLCSGYVAALVKADHFRAGMVVSRDILRLLPEDCAQAVKQGFELQLAKCLRMTHSTDEALDILRRLRDSKWDKKHREQVLINLALGLESKNSPEAVTIAGEILELKTDSNAQWQAKGIILSAENSPDKTARLLKLEVDARNNGATMTANNLALDRASNLADTDSAQDVLRQVARTSAETGDLYTSFRAIVDGANLMLNSGGIASTSQVRQLIAAYQYFYSQRNADNLFTKTHRALWGVFEKRADTRSLLRLFRNSSFIWRLNERESQEAIYIKRLINAAKHISGENMLLTDSDTAYFILRLRHTAEGVSAIDET